ncbi:MAG: DNA recombination protein RmuC, partial [SAR324 cluster bacterium]|nr:DNA recombination protein RmuC [SAR324 cluster bacterium]
MISTQSQEIDALGESLNELLKKYDIILADKIELDKQFAILKQDANRIPEIEEELKFQQKQFSSLQV